MIAVKKQITYEFRKMRDLHLEIITEQHDGWVVVKQSDVEGFILIDKLSCTVWYERE